MTNRRRYLGYAIIGLLFCGGCQSSDGEHQSRADQIASPQVAQTTPLQAAAEKDATLILESPPEDFRSLVSPTRSPRTIELISVPVTEAPVIDGQVEESAWATAPAITTLDFASQRPIRLQSVYTDESIFFLVTYPDAAPSETHKSWGWDPEEDIYKPMPDREDMFVFKWSLVGDRVSLALREAEPHRADIWFWKAHRTNPLGYADDKWQVVSMESQPKSKILTSTRHGELHFRRVGDSGMSAYGEKIFYKYQGDILPRYYPRPSEGSRADIRAKGVWHEGKWTVEWSRPLQTGHSNDVVFKPGQVYLFAVSCYEMSADVIHPQWSQPLYRAGDAFDRLFLRFADKESS